jgi:hypothetical protein
MLPVDVAVDKCEMSKSERTNRAPMTC